MANHILLIDDNADTLDAISAILQLAHYTVSTATNGKDGVDKALKLVPDLILCDIIMPGLDGFGVLHILRNNPETERIPFIFISARAERSDVRTGMNLGADDYITKPFDGSDLLSVIEMRLKRSQRLQSPLPLRETSPQSHFTDIVDRTDGKRMIRMFRRRDLLFMEGQHPSEMYRIEKGVVKTYKVNFDGKELITGIHRAGDFVGFIPLLEDKAYNENAEAMEPVEVSVIQKHEFICLIYEDKSVAKKFIHELAKNVEEMGNRLMDIAYLSVRQRVARALLSLEENSAANRENKVIRIPRRDISNIVGTAVESLNRTLADLKDEKVIEISDEGLVIINKEKLSRVIRM